MVMDMDHNAMDSYNTDKALSAILSNFDINYILGVVEDSLSMKFRPYTGAMPTLDAVESSFRNAIDGFNAQEDRDKIMEVRYNTYMQVIDKIAKYYDLTITQNIEPANIYTAAYFVHNFFVANFTNSLINFFVNFIVDQQDSLYEYLVSINLDGSKDKSSASSYSKRVYINQKLGTIHANIGVVLDAICNMEITLDQLVAYAIQGDQMQINFLINFLEENTNVFQNHFAPYVRDVGTRFDLITRVKLELQKYNRQIFDVKDIVES